MSFVITENFKVRSLQQQNAELTQTIEKKERQYAQLEENLQEFTKYTIYNFLFKVQYSNSMKLIHVVL